MRKCFIAVAITAALAIMGCTDTTNEAVATLIRDGFIKGDVTGHRGNGSPMNFSFDFSMQDYPTEYDVPSSGRQIVWIERIPDFAATWNGDSYAELGIWIDSLDQDTAAFYYGYVEHLVPVGDSVVYWRMYNYNPNGRILSYHYDAATQTISGTYTFSGTDYYGYPSTVTGSYESKLRLTMYKSISKK